MPMLASVVDCVYKFVKWSGDMYDYHFIFCFVSFCLVLLQCNKLDSIKIVPLFPMIRFVRGNIDMNSRDNCFKSSFSADSRGFFGVLPRFLIS